jgi:hypothetical protein
MRKGEKICATICAIVFIVLAASRGASGPEQMAMGGLGGGVGALVGGLLRVLIR